MRSSSAAVVFGIQARGTLELDVVTAASDAAPEGSEPASIDAAQGICPPVTTLSDARIYSPGSGCCWLEKEQDLDPE